MWIKYPEKYFQNLIANFKNKKTIKIPLKSLQGAFYKRNLLILYYSAAVTKIS